MTFIFIQIVVVLMLTVSMVSSRAIRPNECEAKFEKCIWKDTPDLGPCEYNRLKCLYDYCQSLKTNKKPNPKRVSACLLKYRVFQ
ncbi:hypothetical protein ScPMuIL_013283 [Solemya velum]